MLDISRDIDSLSNFKRKTTQFVRQLKETGEPLVLTVNGKAELVVQDAAAYQELLELKERWEAIEGIRRGLEDIRKGRTVPMAEAFAFLESKHKIPREP
jgi:prevent-host-death family protein